ncbi:MAG: sugar ABC transporter ATP-binding protein [Verrucomicrobiota bacterium]|jgi:ribose transport system ATP-binding protein
MAPLPSSIPSTLLSARAISKRFPGVLALDGVSLELSPGEVLGLVGENGAGKSTLIKILGGILTPDGGDILLEGRPVSIPGAQAAKAFGIALIHQERMLAANLDLAANVFLGEERRFTRWGALNRKPMNAAAEQLLRRVGLNFPASTPLQRLSSAEMHFVEIAKALALKARILIMDEPTASMTPREAARLFEIISEVRGSGVAVIYVSHRMEEILLLATRITVLRDGRWVGDFDAKTSTRDQIVSAMIGRKFSTWFPPRSRRPGEAILEARALRVAGAPEGASFVLHRGEILGFAGLVGSGRTELMRTLFGLAPSLGGDVRLGGASWAARSSSDAIEHGIGLVPEDRKLQGLVLNMSVADNISLPTIARRGLCGWLHRARERDIARQQVEHLGIRTSSERKTVLHLSGGNQQKVVLGKWLSMQLKVLILDEPTRGIDVNAKSDLYRQITALADSGLSLIVVSSDMEEILGLCDRVVVMHERHVAGILSRKEMSESQIARLMTGDTCTT